MTEEALEVGRVYIVAARGFMKLERKPGPKEISFQMQAHGNMNYWAGRDEIRGPVYEKFLEQYDADAKARNLPGRFCDDPECWCHSLLKENQG